MAIRMKITEELLHSFVGKAVRVQMGGDQFEGQLMAFSQRHAQLRTWRRGATNLLSGGSVDIPITAISFIAPLRE